MFNDFWQSVISNWSKLNCTEFHATPEVILSQPIFLNNDIKINNKKVFRRKWIENGIFFINDLIDNNGSIYNFESFKRKYNLNINILDFLGIKAAIPNEWKNKIKNIAKKDTITTENIKYMKEHSKITKYFNTLMIKKLKPDRTNFRNKWNELLSTTIDEQRWKYIYKQVFSLTDDTLLKMFQYKIINNIQYTNDKLFKWNIIETELCTFCNETKETMCHLIWECRHSKTIWLRFRDIIEYKLCIT